MSKRITRQDLTLEFAVGAFFFLALALLAYFTVILNRESLGGPKDSLRMTFPEVAGLDQGDAVLARGVQIGTVKSLSLDTSGVSVVANLDRTIDIHQGYSIDIRFSSILGGRFIAIDPGPPTAERIPDNAVLNGNPPADILADASEMIQQLSLEITSLRDSLDEGGLLENLAEMTANLKDISSDVRQGKGTLGKLVTDDQLYDQARTAAANLAEASQTIQRAGEQINQALTDARQGKGTLGKLLVDDELYTHANALVADLKNGRGTLGKLLTDDSLHADLQAVCANLRKLTDELGQGNSTVARLLADDGTLFVELQDGIQAYSDIARRIQRGEGTIGKLVTDDAVYQETRRTIGEIRAAIEDLREQAPIATFGSFVFGAL